MSISVMSAAWKNFPGGGPELLTLLALADWADDEGYCYPSMRRIAHKTRDISGSAHFWNKADNCIIVWRDLADSSQDVQIHVQKVRWKHIGRIGVAALKYDRATGRYCETAPKAVQSYREASNGN